VDELCTGLLKHGYIHAEALRDGMVAVITEALCIGNGDQEEVKGCCRMAAAVEVAVTDEAMIQPTELFGNFPDTLRADRKFLYHGVLLSSGG
jgi:hypothetical protein